MAKKTAKVRKPGPHNRPTRAAAAKRSGRPPRETLPGPKEDGLDGAGTGIRVLCVDDHEVLVEGLRAQFGIRGAIRVVGWLPSAERLLDETARLNPDVVLLDIEMPGPDAFETADRLKHMYPNVRVVFLSAHVRDGYIAAAYKCGARGYFAKGDDLNSIVQGLLQVARGRANSDGEGEFVMGPKVQERCLAPGPAAQPRAQAVSTHEVPVTPLAALSEREIEVLRLIGRGRPRNEIAHELSRSAKTIDGHQERIMKKLRIATRAELMRFAIREGLAEA